MPQSFAVAHACIVDKARGGSLSSAFLMQKHSTQKANCVRQSRAKGRARRAAWCLLLAVNVAASLVVGACSGLSNPFRNRPQVMGEVPANRLAYRLEADFAVDKIPPALIADEAMAERLSAIQKDFDERRNDDALIRTVVSPDGQRALALYLAGETPEGDFRLDIYSADGRFLSNVMPENLTGALPLAAAWSPDGGAIAFIGYESQGAQAARERGETPENRPPGTGDAANPSATVAPLIAPVAVFATEQIYICDRDGHNLRPLTQREGLIYFDFAWSPDARAISALACREDEWAANAAEGFAPRGRPRLISLDNSGERLLDDRLTSVTPAWSPDGAKVATAFDTEVVIYDVLGANLTIATLPLRDSLLAASRQYDQAQTASDAAKKTNPAKSNTANPSANADAATPLSFNPVTRLEWVEPDGILAQTGFVRTYKNSLPIRRYERWHVLHLSPQAELLGHVRTTAIEPLLAARFAAHL